MIKNTIFDLSSYKFAARAMLQSIKATPPSWLSPEDEFESYPMMKKMNG
jgi:hypothetical protein